MLNLKPINSSKLCHGEFLHEAAHKLIEDYFLLSHLRDPFHPLEPCFNIRIGAEIVLHHPKLGDLLIGAQVGYRRFITH